MSRESYIKYNAKRFEKIKQEGLLKLQAFVTKDTKSFIENNKNEKGFQTLGDSIDDIIKSLHSPRGE